MSRPQCEFLRANGEQCKRLADDGVTYCWAHREDLAPEERQARSPKRIEPPTLKTYEDLLDYTVQQMYRLEVGEVDVQFANSMKDHINMCYRILQNITSVDNADRAADIAKALSDDDE